MLCARYSDGEYCAEHQRTIDVVDVLDREIQQLVREKREHRA